MIWYLVQVLIKQWACFTVSRPKMMHGLDCFRTVVLIKRNRHAEPSFSCAFQEHGGMIKRPRLPETGSSDLLTNKFWGQLKVWGCKFLWKCLFVTLQYRLILSVGVCSMSAVQEARVIFKNLFWTFLLYGVQKKLGHKHKGFVFLDQTFW